jgi:hypothetical protein
MSPSLRFRRVSWLLIIFLLFPFLKAEAIQSTFGLGAAKAQKPSAAQPVYQTFFEAPKPQLLNADSNPTLRYPVSVWESSISCGWFDVTRSGVSYTVVESGNKGRGGYGKKFVGSGGVQYLVAPAAAAGSEEFDVSLSEITKMSFRGSLFFISFARRSVLITYLPQDQWGTVEKLRQFEGASKLNLSGTMAIQRAMQNFDSVLAEVKPPAPPPLDVNLHAEPSTVEKGRTVTLVWSSSNATSLDLQPGVGRVAAAGGLSLQPQDSTNYTLTATGPAGTKAASVYVTVTQTAASLPTLVLTEPSAGDGQTVVVSSSPLTIRGVVMDASGIPAVTVNGNPVTMRPTSAQAAQFTSDPIALQPGENRFEVSAINSAHGHAKVAFVARLTASTPKTPSTEPTANSKGLGKAEILGLLQGDVPSARVADLVKERGVKFVPTPDDLKDIRGAGGGDDLIDAINLAAASPKN